MRTTKASSHAGKNVMAYIINCPQIMLSEDATVFLCVRNSLVLYFWGCYSVGPNVWMPGRHTKGAKSWRGQMHTAPPADKATGK